MKKITYKTLKENFQYEIDKIKGSRFIGTLIKVPTRDKAEQELEAIRKKYYNATHNCFAYIVGTESDKISRFGDDGEMSGTAGKPMMLVMESSEITNTLLIVTRYYGGTKLGTGGLIKAYTNSTKETLAHSNIIDVEIKDEIEFRYVYDNTSIVMNLINKYEAEIVE
ncbi:MAG: YigZ family protein [Candidatus Delongbacteria bacterium]|nr:YigZ family protein [Candidatus Delongbacteria bacterium]